jgi:hypothetical protein
MVSMAIKERLGLEPSLAYIQGVVIVLGAVAGAGIALGALYQPTEASIHTGHAFKGLFDAASIFLLGAVPGAAAGLVIGLPATGRRAPTAALAALMGLLFAGVVGWVVVLGRPTIDCDEGGSCQDHPRTISFP